jgi:hypothetical protein
LLIQILPKLGGSGWLVLSGILRKQEELVRALQRTQLDIIGMKRRGKWLALLPSTHQHSAAAGLSGGKFCGDHRPPLQ